MKVLKFKIHEGSYERFKSMCLAKETSVKAELYSIMLDDRRPSHIHDYFPEDHDEHLRKMTLKVNEDLFSGVMSKCRNYEFSVKDYLAYLIYRGLLDEEENS